MNDAQSSMMMSQLSSSASRSANTFDDGSQEANSLNTTFFALFDDLVQSIHLPNFLNLLAFIELQLQFIATSFWFDTNRLCAGNGVNHQTLVILTKIAYFFPLEINNDDQMILPLIFFSVIVAVSLFFLSITFIYFKVERKSLIWATYIARFLNEIGGLILFHPLMKFTGQIIMKLANDFTLLTVISLVLCVIYIVFYVIVLSIILDFVNGSALIDKSVMMTFDSSAIKYIFFFDSVIILCQFIFPILPSWTDYFLLAAHFLIILYGFLRTGFLPFRLSYINIIFNATLLSQLLLNILMIIGLANVKWPGAIFPSLVCFVYVISIVVSSLYYYYRVKKVACLFYYDSKKPVRVSIQGNSSGNASNSGTNSNINSNRDTIILNDQDKIDRYNEIKLTFYPQVLMYLHYGLDKVCDMFVDWSFIKFLAQSNPSTPILVACLRFVVLFPGEIRLANILVNMVGKRRDLSSSDRFILYQITKIKLLRQTSASIHSTERLIEIKNYSKNCRNEIISFFDRSNCNIGLLLKINSMLDHTRIVWEESLKLFANSPVFREEYAKFLIESDTDFEEAIMQTHKKDLIESGVNFSNDVCFKSFVNSYPEYLKKKVIDLKGNVIRVLSSKTGEQSQSSNKINTISTSTDIDQKIEEEIGRTIITQAKVRLALQNATQGKDAANSKRFTALSLFIIALSLVLFIAIFIIFGEIFNTRYDMNDRSIKVTFTRTYTSLSSLFLLLQFGNYTGRFSIPELYIYEWYGNGTESRDNGFYNSSLAYIGNSLMYNILSESQYNDMVSNFAEFANTNEGTKKIFVLAYELMNDVVPNQLCIGGRPVASKNYSLSETAISNMVAQRILLGFPNATQWLMENEFFCSIYGTINQMSSSYENTRNLITNDQIKTANDVEGMIFLLKIILPIIYVIVVLIPFYILINLYFRELKYFTNMMLSLESNTKKEAMNQIRKGDNDNEPINLTSGNKVPHSYVLDAYVVAISLFTILQGILVFLQLDEAGSLNTKFHYIAVWSFKSSSRVPLMIEVLISVYMSIFLSGPDPIKTLTTNLNIEIKSAQIRVKKIEEARDVLLLGSDDVPPLTGFDEIIDYLMSSSKCDSEVDNVSVHDSYLCVSNNVEVLYFLNMWNDILLDLPNYNSKANKGTALEIFHLALQHVAPQLKEIDEQFDSLGKRFISQFKMKNTIYFVVELFSSLISFIFLVFFIKKLNGSFKAAKVLLRRISPIAIVGKPEMVNYLLDISTDKKDIEISTTASIVHNSQDGIFCLGLTGTVEVVNQSVINILGFTPEQMLGQSLSNMCDEESAELVKNQLGLMGNHQASLSFESHIKCINNNDIVIPCSITILGICNGDNKLSSFVVVIREETELVQQQQQAEKAKQQSESLLYEILPRDIVIRLNQGEKDISFSLPSATIAFIDMVKFSEYSMTLTPQQIMGNLSQIFGGFDECLMKYQMLTKIKLIGDVYMCAAGLFEKEDNPVAHAEQMVRFTLEALQQLDEFNIKMSSLLNCRIGVNTGGPLIAGVLGTDKPVFDIIGDPINIASRLQSTDIPGKIQISQATYDIVKHLDFNIESRGEVFLKGKGKQEAYLISPTIAQFQMSSYEIGGTDNHNSQNASSVIKSNNNNNNNNTNNSHSGGNNNESKSSDHDQLNSQQVNPLPF